MNQPEALEIAFQINEDTLKESKRRLDSNPYDQKSLKIKQQVLDLLREGSYEAIVVHRNPELATLGKRIYDHYSESPLILPELPAPKSNLESKF